MDNQCFFCETSVLTADSDKWLEFSFMIYGEVFTEIWTLSVHFVAL